LESPGLNTGSHKTYLDSGFNACPQGFQTICGTVYQIRPLLLSSINPFQFIFNDNNNNIFRCYMNWETLNRTNNWIRLNYTFTFVKNNYSWVKRNQLDATYFIIYSILIQCSTCFGRNMLSIEWVLNKWCLYAVWST